MLRENEPYINQSLLDRVMKAREDEYLHDDSWKVWERDLDVQEARHLSELCRQMESFTQEDLAVATIVAVKNFPEMVFQIMMEEYLSVVNKDKERTHKNEDSEDV